MVKKVTPVKPAKKVAKRRPKRASHPERLRYAYPFFTDTPPQSRAVDERTGKKRMADFASAKLGPIPSPLRSPVMDLKDIIGQPGVAEIQTVVRSDFTW